MKWSEKYNALYIQSLNVCLHIIYAYIFKACLFPLYSVFSDIYWVVRVSDVGNIFLPYFYGIDHG